MCVCSASAESNVSHGRLQAGSRLASASFAASFAGIVFSIAIIIIAIVVVTLTRRPPTDWPPPVNTSTTTQRPRPRYDPCYYLAGVCYLGHRSRGLCYDVDEIWCPFDGEVYYSGHCLFLPVFAPTTTAVTTMAVTSTQRPSTLNLYSTLRTTRRLSGWDSGWG